jgi:hypothetical protein
MALSISNTPRTGWASAGCGSGEGGGGGHDENVALFDVWVPNWSSTSCDLGVFVYQPVEQIATSEVKLGWRRRWW